MNNLFVQMSVPAEHHETMYRDYIALLKPRVMSLVVFSGVAGMVVAPGIYSMHPFMLIIAVACLAFGAGAAGAFNMWYDRDIDAVMTRTKSRPLPAGKIDPDNALAFSIFVSILAVMIMGLALNWLAAGILAFANIFYSVIYTILLKRSTAQNIVIGGAAGAFPPMIGWACVAGDISLYPVLLFLIIFLWTPPHFWALSLFANKDYRRANIPMMSVRAGERSTKWQMLIYTILLFPVAVAPYSFGFTGTIYGVISILLSALFIISALRTLKDSSYKSARQMFAYSVFYLFALFSALMIDSLY